MWVTVLVPCLAFISEQLTKTDVWWHWAFMLSLMLFSCGSLFKTACMDPGICGPPEGYLATPAIVCVEEGEAEQVEKLPEGARMMQDENTVRELQLEKEDAIQREDVSRVEEIDVAIVKLQRSLQARELLREHHRSAGTRWCNHCQLHQPKGSQHCRDCGVCVREYDHHCPFMAQCVGGGNIQSFYSFLATAVILPLSMFVMLIIIEGPPESKRNQQAGSRL